MDFKDLCASQLVELAGREFPDEDTRNAGDTQSAAFGKLKAKCGNSQFSNDDFECSKGLPEVARKKLDATAESFCCWLADGLQGFSHRPAGMVESMYHCGDTNPNRIMFNAGATVLTERMIRNRDDPLWQRAFSDPEKCEQILESFISRVQCARSVRSDWSEQDCFNDAVEHRLDDCRTASVIDFEVMLHFLKSRDERSEVLEGGKDAAIITLDPGILRDQLREDLGCPKAAKALSNEDLCAWLQGFEGWIEEGYWDRVKDCASDGTFNELAGVEEEPIQDQDQEQAGEPGLSCGRRGR